MSRGNRLTGMDGMFANTNIVVLIIFSFCCGIIALVLGIVGLITCTDPLARRNALIVTIISGIMTVANVIAYYSGALQNVNR